ncbi:gliding motility-associated C-terminal domain-containing protein, partial [Mesonia mobilis]|uniref:gliding motility-associated C-terminal domain-containing protein n=1 Tax=Mesonia mobilis TaxID=369791 RepID=UPI0026E9C630
VFDITVNTANISGSQDPNLFTVTYHTSQTSAINDGNSIIFPTQFTLNTAGCQTLYVRIESNTNSSCFSVSDFQVCANAVSLGSVSDLNACNNSIDLTANEADLLNGENPNNYNISYHNSQADADGNSNEITNISAFDGCQTIFVRVESINDASCYQTESFEACALFVNPGTPINLNACSGNELPTTFDLTQNESNILNGNSFNISYFESLAEAENNQNAITTTNNYQALNDTQTIYVRVENTNDANCYSIVTYDIETFYGGLTTNEVSLTLCTEELNNPIDLTASEDQLGLNTDESIEAYYSTLTDATNQTNPIDNPTNYSGGNNQEFYIRIENNDPSICYAITRLVIEDEICELFIPEGFSPNADGINDNFEISGLYENYRFDLKIYQRNGRKIYDGTNNTTPWNGSFEGHELPVGTYYYVLDIKSPDSRMYKGWVYLNK